ncbi:MAG TPA: CBS domain-containing protein, partial [Acidimicrobiia bacterium]|nr:CBS domain-containing protein [Acidimicrobiia bacterium]
QVMTEPLAFGPGMPAAEARRLLTAPSAPVVEDGRLVGVVHRRALDRADRGSVVGSVMDDPIAAFDDAGLEVLIDLPAEVDPVPVVDHAGRLRGVIAR